MQVISDVLVQLNSRAESRPVADIRHTALGRLHRRVDNAPSFPPTLELVSAINEALLDQNYSRTEHSTYPTTFEAIPAREPVKRHRPT